MPKMKAYAYAVGARSAFDIAGTSTLCGALFSAPRRRTADADAAIANDFGLVMARFGLSAKCARNAIASGQDIDRLPVGCTDGELPRRLPLRHVTARHTTVRH